MKTILFQGDSITDAGRNRISTDKNAELGCGYVTMIAGELCFRYPEIQVINKGISGNRIADTYGTWQEDVLNTKYDLLSILTGINDVGFGLRLGRGSDQGRFEFIYDRMIYEALESNPNGKIVLCQPFVMKKDLRGTLREKNNDIYRDWNIWESEVQRRDEVVKRLAERYQAIYVPFWDDLRKTQERIPVEELTIDCIHLTATGHYVLAQSWIRATEDFFVNGRE